MVPNDILKLMEGGIDLVLSGGETHRGENWHDENNTAQKDERITVLMENTSFREDAKEAFIQQMEMGWEDLFMGRMAIGWRSATEKVKPWITKFMNLMIEWGRSCWTARNGMIFGEKRQRYTVERKRLQEMARVYLYAPKEESLVPIKNIKATRRSVRNLPNIEIANWIAEQKRARQKIRQRRTTNMLMHLRQEAELQILDHRFKTRINDATRYITPMQQNQTNAVNNNNNIEMDQLSRVPHDEEPPD